MKWYILSAGGSICFVNVYSGGQPSGMKAYIQDSRPSPFQWPRLSPRFCGHCPVCDGSCPACDGPCSASDGHALFPATSLGGEWSFGLTPISSHRRTKGIQLCLYSPLTIHKRSGIWQPLGFFRPVGPGRCGVRCPWNSEVSPSSYAAPVMDAIDSASAAYLHFISALIMRTHVCGCPFSLVISESVPCHLHEAGPLRFFPLFCDRHEDFFSRVWALGPTLQRNTKRSPEMGGRCPVNGPWARLLSMAALASEPA